MSEIMKENKDAVLNEEELGAADGGAVGYPVHSTRVLIRNSPMYSSPYAGAYVIMNLPAGNRVLILGGSATPGMVYCRSLYPNEGFVGYIPAANIG